MKTKNHHHPVQWIASRLCEACILRPRLLWLASVLILMLPLEAAPPDLTAGGVPDSTLTINLGPTGMRGWIYLSGGAGTTYGADGTLANKNMNFDSDGDGLATGVEWVLGGDPTLASDSAGKAPVLDNTSDPNYFIYTYRRTDAANADPKTSITVEYGSDLGGWTPATPDGTNIIVTPSDNFHGNSPGVEKVEVKIKRTLATNGKLFTRLKVVITP